jgi:hypothetical protein
VGSRFQVLFHSPRRGSFRLSLAVLLLYRSYLVFSLGSWSTRIPAGFLVPRRTQAPPKETSPFRVRGFHPLCQAFPMPFRYSKVFSNSPLSGRRPYNPAIPGGLGSSGFARRYSRNHSYFLFPGYLDGSVPPVSPPRPIYSTADAKLALGGLPHSATGGSQDVCSSPPLFAACHGLPRLDTPRHPPQTLLSLDHIILPLNGRSPAL